MNNLTLSVKPKSKFPQELYEKVPFGTYQSAYGTDAYLEGCMGGDENKIVINHEDFCAYLIYSETGNSAVLYTDDSEALTDLVVAEIEHFDTSVFLANK